MTHGATRYGRPADRGRFSCVGFRLYALSLVHTLPGHADRLRARARVAGRSHDDDAGLPGSHDPIPGLPDPGIVEIGVGVPGFPTRQGGGG